MRGGGAAAAGGRAEGEVRRGLATSRSLFRHLIACNFSSWSGVVRSGSSILHLARREAQVSRSRLSDQSISR